MNGRIINGETGQVESEAPNAFEAPPWSRFGAVDNSIPTAPAVADFFGVPVKWVLIAGVVIWVGSYFLKRGR